MLHAFSLQLAPCISDPRQCDRNLKPFPSQAHEAVIKLRDNLRAEQHVVLEFAIAVFRGVFKPKQMAMLLVKCYPAVPDALGIASALASELGEPDSPHARHLAMQLGGYLEAPGAMAGGGGGGGLGLGGFGGSMASIGMPGGLSAAAGVSGLGGGLGTRLSVPTAMPGMASNAGASGLGGSSSMAAGLSNLGALPGSGHMGGGGLGGGLNSSSFSGLGMGGLGLPK